MTDSEKFFDELEGTPEGRYPTLDEFTQALAATAPVQAKPPVKYLAVYLPRAPQASQPKRAQWNAISMATSGGLDNEGCTTNRRSWGGCTT